jgi:hypothetical protein
LDATLARYDGWKGVDHIGEPLPGAQEFMEQLCRLANVVVFTTRTKADDESLGRNGKTKYELASLVESWLKNHDIPYHEVYVGQGKPIASAYVDDRAVSIKANPNEEDYSKALEAVRGLL